MKLSLKQMLSAATGGLMLLLSLAAHAQIVIPSPPVHTTASSKRFVRPADPQTILPVLSRVPSLNPQLYSHLTPQQVQAATPNGIAGAPAKLKFGMTPYERLMKPFVGALLGKANSAHVPTGLSLSPNARPMTANPSLPVNFPGLFGTPSVPATLTSDTSPVVASLSMDVNQDGKTDLVTVQNDGTVNVLLGSGTFSALQVTSINKPQLLNDVYYVFAAEADMNKDGYPDLVVTDEYNTAAFVYINAKNGTFLPPVEYDFTFSTGVGFQTGGGGIAIGDINGDGYPDLVGVAFDPGFDANSNPATTVSILSMLNNGNGTLAAALPEVTTPEFLGYIESGIAQVLLADMNKDGKLDLIVPASGFDQNFNSLIGIPIMLGTGTGSFAAYPTTLPTPAASIAALYDDTNAGFATADVNGDGNPDILFTFGTDSVFVALGNGNGTIQAPTAVVSNDGTTNFGGASLVQYADVNGDGKIDIVGYDGGFFAVYLGQGGGVFAQTPLVQLISGSCQFVEPLPADFNGDGKADIVQVDQLTGRAGLYPQSAGTFLGIAPLHPATETAQGFQAVATGDINGDGIPDIVALDRSTENSSNYDSSIVAGINDGKGNFTYSTLISGTSANTDGLSGIEPFLVDLNGDGKADLLLTSYSGSGLLVTLNNGDGTYAAPVAVKLPNSPACQINYIDLGDVNGDGFPDIVAAYGGDAACLGSVGSVPSGIYVLLNNGKGSFTGSFTPFGLAAYLVKLADLNGDGKLDLVISDYSPYFSFYYLYDVAGNGDGTFNLATSQYVMENTIVSSLIPGDFDGDGKTDLAVGVLTQVDGNIQTVYNTTGTYLLKGNGDLTFQLPVQYTPGVYPIAGSYADFNGDGRPDLALLLATYNDYTDILSGNAATLINLGGGAFAGGPVMYTAPDGDSGFLFTSDFNGDGAVDALFSPQVALGYNDVGLSELFLNNGAVSFALTSSSATVTQDSNVTLTATLTPTVGKQSPTGTVSFYGNGTLIGTASVVSGSATLTLSTLPVGSDVIAASYSGDSNFNPAKASTSVTVTVSALAPSFTLSATSPAALSLTQGASGAFNATVTTNGTFAGTVSFSCSGMPADTSCTLNPYAVTLGANQSSTVSVLVETSAPGSSFQAKSSAETWGKTATVVSCAGLLILLLPGGRRGRRSLRRIMSIVVLGLAMAGGLTGCGGNGNRNGGTTPGSYTFTLTASSATVTQSTTFIVNVSN